MDFYRPEMIRQRAYYQSVFAHHHGGSICEVDFPNRCRHADDNLIAISICACKIKDEKSIAQDLRREKSKRGELVKEIGFRCLKTGKAEDSK